MICPICKGNLVKKKIEYKLLGEHIGQFIGEICTKCGEQYFSKETSFAIEDIVKKKGLWDLKSKTKVNQLGNTLAIRLNKKLINYLNLKKGEEVIIYPEGKQKIIIGRVKTK